MDPGRLVKWIIVAAVLFVIWKEGLPWLQRQRARSAAPGASAQSESSCPAAAARASAAWGSGIGRFVNPPYDMEAWNLFRADVDAKIAAAESECRCQSQSCEKAAWAMSELRRLVTELDASIRTGSPPPSDAAQRQESIDSAIDNAAELTREGK